MTDAPGENRTGGSPLRPAEGTGADLTRMPYAATDRAPRDGCSSRPTIRTGCPLPACSRPSFSTPL